MSFNDPFLKDLENLSESSKEEKQDEESEVPLDKEEEDSFVEP